jgi:dihydrodipicolinate synthase/N-acetylneuraminate lyase
MTSPAESAASQPTSASIADIAGIADIEQALRQILQAVSDGQDNRIGPLVEQLGTLIQSLNPAGGTAAAAAAGAATPQDLQRVMDLWKETSLALASASQQACADLQRIAAGRSTLRAYRP